MEQRLDRPHSKRKPSLHRSFFEGAADALIVVDLNSGLVLQANMAAGSMHGCPAGKLVGRRFSALIHPDSRDEFCERLTAFQEGRPFEALTRQVRADGSEFDAEWRAAASTYEGRPCLLVVIRDVSGRIRAEQQARYAAAAHAREQSRLLDVSHALASTLEFQPGWVLEELRQIVEYSRAGLFGLVDSALVCLAMRGTPDLKSSAPCRIDLHGADTLDALFSAHRPTRVADIRSGTRQARFLRSLLHDEAAALIVGMQSWMWVPLSFKGRILGGLGLAHGKAGFFTAHHAEMALSVADQAAITMINAEMYSRAGSVAAFQERQRLAESLHDAVNQSLFSVGLIAEVLPRLWDQGQDRANQSLAELHRLTRGAMAEMRGLLAELSPSAITEAQLGDLLHQLGNALSGRTNIPVKTTVIGEGTLPPDVQLAIYQICQEAVNNIARHAEAHSATISIRHGQDSVEIRIADDGKGFDPAGVPSGRYGMSLMRERAEAIGALLSIQSRPGRGTELVIQWPNPSHAEVP